VIEVPPDWPLRVKAQAPGYCEELYQDVFAGAELLFVLDRGTSLIGQVTRKLDASPVEGADVAIFRPGKPGSVQTKTSSDGHYELLGVPPGASVIVVQCAWLADPPWTDVDLPKGAQLIRDFALDEGVTIFGTISDADTGLPISEADIGAGWTFEKLVHSGLDGTYELRGFGGPGGVYEVYARAQGYADARRDFGSGGMPTERTQVNFALKPGYSIRGRVIDPAGTPIAEAYVAAVTGSEPDGVESWKSSRSREDGIFEITSLSSTHQYGLLIRASGWANLVYLLKPFTGSSPMDIGDFQLQIAGSVSGVVVDDQDRPRSDVSTTLYGNNADATGLNPNDQSQLPNNLVERTVRTDQSGHFHFGEVAEGEYTLSARHRSGHQSEPISVRIGVGAHATDIQLVLPSGLRLFGHAVSPAGIGLSGARIELVWGGDQSKDRHTFARDGGTFEFLGLEQGPYTLIVRDNVFEDQPDQSMVVLTGVVPSEEELRIIVPPARKIHGIVLMPEGEPSPHAFVSAQFAGTLLASDFCDDRGSFMLTLPESAACTLQVYTTTSTNDPRYPFRVNHSGPRGMATIAAGDQDVVVRLTSP
jgi:hypothetical protein